MIQKDAYEYLDSQEILEILFVWSGNSEGKPVPVISRVSLSFNSSYTGRKKICEGAEGKGQGAISLLFT